MKEAIHSLAVLASVRGNHYRSERRFLYLFAQSSGPLFLPNPFSASSYHTSAIKRSLHPVVSGYQPNFGQPAQDVSNLNSDTYTTGDHTIFNEPQTNRYPQRYRVSHLQLKLSNEEASFWRRPSPSSVFGPHRFQLARRLVEESERCSGPRALHSLTLRASG